MSVLGQIFAISGKKLFRWYKWVLSGYTKPEEQKVLHENDTYDENLIDKKTKKPKKIYTPVFKPENFGANMAIDEKHVGDEIYTIISNRDTGKMALMIMTTRIKLIKKLLYKLPSKIRFGVETFTMDLLRDFDELVRECFMKALRIGDKFHVLCLAFDALQDVRIRYRQEAIKKETERREAYKLKEAEKRDQAQRNGELYFPEKPPELKRNENEDTEKELLARSRYLLFKFRKDWSETQEQRANILFREFPEIEVAYKITCSFRTIYNIKVGNTKKAKSKLEEWMAKNQNIGIPEIEHLVCTTIANNKNKILNYFEKGGTNANAESLNGKIQRMIIQNYGIRDRDFFHYRLKLSLS